MNRYQYPPVDKIWELTSVQRRWAKIELAHLRALGRKNPKILVEVRDVFDFDATPEELQNREFKTGHDFAAFLELVEEAFVARGMHESARWLHYGLTSSDVVETGLMWAISSSIRTLEDPASKLLFEIVNLPGKKVAGRTHGQPASPTTVAHRFAKVIGLLEKPRDLITQFPGKFGGAVGRNRVFKDECAALAEIGPPTYLVGNRSQVIPPHWMMDQLHRVLKWVTAVEQIAMDLRLMATLGEYIPGKVAAVGSSAMPGKVNPFLAERLSGMAEYWRGLYSSVLGTRALWLERDMSHSCVDRMALPQLFSLAGYMLQLAAKLLKEATWVDQDLSGFEPAIDADVLLGDSTRAVALPRSTVYYRVRDAIWEEQQKMGVRASTDGVRQRLGWFREDGEPVHEEDQARNP